MRGSPVEARIPRILVFLAMSALLHAGLLAGPWIKGRERPPAIEVVLGGPACKEPGLGLFIPPATDRARPVPVGNASVHQAHVQKRARSSLSRRKKIARLDTKKPSRALGKSRARKTGPGPGSGSETRPSATKKMAEASSGRSRAGHTPEASSYSVKASKGSEGGCRSAGRKGRSASGQQGLKGYLSLVRRIIEGNKRYPRRARRLGWQGAVRVSFTVLEDGTITGIELEEPCRYGDLNRAAIKTVQQSSPLPAPPKEIGREAGAPLRIGTTIRFQLR